MPFFIADWIASLIWRSKLSKVYISVNNFCISAVRLFLIFVSYVDKNDDDFNYYFDFIGRPPNGINYFIEHRRIYFSGVPTEKGVFSFSIQLSIGEGIIVPDDGICFGDDSTSKTYRITIN